MTGLRVAVTGAKGFVGGALVRFLRAQGACEVVRCVRPGTEASGDLTYDLLGPPPPLHGIDVVVHAAARVHVMTRQEGDPLPAFRAANVDGTLRLAEAASAAGVRRFVFLSSIAVNGNTATVEQPFTADDVPAPHDAYGVSKFEAERALLALSERSGMEIVIVRPPLVYGPGASGNVQQMLKWLRLGVPLPLAGLGNRRSLVSLQNLVDFLAVCICHPAAAGQVFLVADAEPVSTSQLLASLSRAMGRRPRLFWLPGTLLLMAATIAGRRGWFDRLCGSLVLNIEKNASVVGWSPAQSFEEGIRLTVAPPAENTER